MKIPESPGPSFSYKNLFLSGNTHMNTYFRFKKFTIHQDCTAMKVGTDGVLLGAWADVRNTHRLLDIGTGTGLLALMAAQRTSGVPTDAVEIDPEACRQAEKNIAATPWAPYIRIHNLSVFDFIPEEKYDCILCNPPFFVQSTPTPDPARTLARHCENFSHTRLLEKVSHWLQKNGRFSFILPVEPARELIGQASGYGLHPARITSVLPNPDKPPKRLLVEMSFHRTSPVCDELVIELSRHVYSERYKELTRDFYLNF